MKYRICLYGSFVRIAGGALLLALASASTAQTVKPLLGKLVVKVPVVLLPSNDYWIYVNSQIVSAPPYKQAVAHNTYMHIGPMTQGGRDEFWDATGLAAASSDGRLTYTRPNARAGLFQNKTLQLAPGNYKVELVTRSIDRPSFPFAIASVDANVAIGKTVEIEFGYPSGTNEFPRLAAAGWAYEPKPVNEVIKSSLATLQAIQKKFADDEVVKALSKTLQNITLAPPSQPGVYVSIPDSKGGARELDARQIDLIVGALQWQYALSTPGELANATGEDAPMAGYVVDQIANHNKRIALYLEIAKALEKAKHR